MMRALVIFDSTFGNTKKIAETISNELGKDSKCCQFLILI